jgi:uncharacterized protein (UPF0210 family)
MKVALRRLPGSWIHLTTLVRWVCQESEESALPVIVRLLIHFAAMKWKLVLFILIFCVICTAQSTPGTGSSATGSRPKVRAITAFVRLDRTHYREQVAEALAFLRTTEQAYKREGWEVETIRITTQPFPEIIRGASADEAFAFFRGFDELAKTENFDANIGPAMMNDGDDPAMADMLAQALAVAKVLNGSIMVAGSDGIHWKAVHASARVIKYLEEHSPHSQATFNFTATAMLAPYAPFYPGSYHTGSGKHFSVGLEGANLVMEAFAQSPGHAEAEKRLLGLLQHWDSAAEAIATRSAQQTGWTYEGIDPTPAPLNDVSIGAAIEQLTRAPFGSSGTMTAAGLITRAVRAVKVKQVGYAGLMVPVMEDKRLAQRWAEGTYNIDSLLAYSAVCGTGLDTVPLPGDISEQQLAAIIGDMAALAVKWNKPLSARLQPVAGKKAGERTEYDDPFLTNTLIRALPEQK